MNFADALDKKTDGSEKSQTEILRIKQQIDKEDRIFKKELPLKYTLIEKFHLDELKKLAHDLLGRDTPREYYSDSGTKIELPQYKEDYIHFIVDELRLPEIKEYALKHKIA